MSLVCDDDDVAAVGNLGILFALFGAKFLDERENKSMVFAQQLF